jgi:hypothetical protein
MVSRCPASPCLALRHCPPPPPPPPKGIKDLPSARYRFLNGRKDNIWPVSGPQWSSQVCTKFLNGTEAPGFSNSALDITVQGFDAGTSYSTYWSDVEVYTVSPKSTDESLTPIVGPVPGATLLSPPASPMTQLQSPPMGSIPIPLPPPPMAAPFTTSPVDSLADGQRKRNLLPLYIILPFAILGELLASK